MDTDFVKRLLGAIFLLSGIAIVLFMALAVFTNLGLAKAAYGNTPVLEANDIAAPEEELVEISEEALAAEEIPAAEAAETEETIYEESGWTAEDYDYTYEPVTGIELVSSDAYISAEDFQRDGIYYGDNGYTYTYYSEKVLPGGGLVIPGRHVNGDGYVVDGQERFCVASDNYPYGTEIEVPFGEENKKAVVYDCGSGYGNIDVYVSW